MKTILRGLAAAALLTSVAAGALAQDFHQNPTYGAIQLNAGFTPDPFQVNLQSGGSIDAASTIGANCTGHIANAPDYLVSYTPGQYPLIISVNSDQDTTLVINAPDGKWYCDDDGGLKGLNPSIRFDSPQSGQYDIWVGTYGSGELHPSTLQVSEVNSQ